MPEDKSLYLEGRNQIIHSEKITVDCDTNFYKEFIVKNHLSTLNTHTAFRAYIGKANNEKVFCTIAIEDFECFITNDNLAYPGKNYNPPDTSELDPKLSLLPVYDTRNGYYT